MSIMRSEDIVVRISKIELFHKALPRDGVTIELRNPEENLWAVKTAGGLNVAKDMTCDFEPSPSNRTEEWLKRFRFSEGEAKEVAAEYIIKKHDEAVEYELERKNRKTSRASRIQEN